jgi:hypothetical protein
MPDKINIPVTVTGAAEAKAELAQVAQGVQEVKQAAAGQPRDALGRFAARQAAPAETAATAPAAVAAPTPSAAPPAGTAAPTPSAAPPTVPAEQQPPKDDTDPTKKAASATEELIGKKRALAAIVTLLGGSFGAEISQVGSLVSLLTSATGVVASVGAALAGLAVGIRVFNELKEAAEKAAAAQRAYNEAVAEGQAQKREGATGIAEGLEKFGARTEENIKAATQMQDRLRGEWGIPKEAAGQAATLATGAGVGLEDAVRIATLRGAGARIESPADAQRALRGAAGQSQALLDEARRHAADTVGRAERIQAAAPQVGGMGEVGPERATFEALKAQPGGLEASGLPRDMSFTQFQKYLVTPREPTVTEVAIAGFPKAQIIKRPPSGVTAVQQLVRQAEAIGAGTRGPQTAPTLTEPRGPSEEGRVIQHVVNNYNHTTHNVDSQYVGPGFQERLRNYESQEAGGIE